MRPLTFWECGRWERRWGGVGEKFSKYYDIERKGKERKKGQRGRCFAGDEARKLVEVEAGHPGNKDRRMTEDMILWNRLR